MFVKSTIALASLALFAQGAYAATCVRKYTVKAGDYCDSISAANGVSTYQLAALNAGKINVACDNLVPGQELCLGTDEVDCRDTTVVLAGNTCSNIWKDKKVDSNTFYTNNPQVSKDCKNIYIDEVLCVAKTVQVPAPPTVPIHTGPPPSQATPPVPVSSPIVSPAPTAAPTKAPANVAPVPSSPVAIPSSPVAVPSSPAAAPSSPAAPEEEECADEYEEIEVVEGDTDEELPFCDELL